jgi:hypothetical protein
MQLVVTRGTSIYSGFSLSGKKVGMGVSSLADIRVIYGLEN